MSETSNAVPAAFRAVADLIEANPALPVPVVTRTGLTFWALYSWDTDAPAKVAAIRRAVGGTWTKSESASGERLRFARNGYEISVEREAVCERRVVGVETVTIPAREAQPERTVEQEIVEWDCSPVLAAEVVTA